MAALEGRRRGREAVRACEVGEDNLVGYVFERGEIVRVDRLVEGEVCEWVS